MLKAIPLEGKMRALKNWFVRLYKKFRTDLVFRMLDNALKAAAQESVISLDLDQDRFIIFSDHHKGARDDADDFQRSEKAYNAALAYYYELGHTLVVLGDAEELWEEAPERVLQAYPATIALEAKFHADGRYVRIWGNHDDDWQFEGAVSRHLDSHYGNDPGNPLRVRESLLVRATEGPKDHGHFFFVHGHQGTIESDLFRAVSRPFIRFVWRPIQRLTKIAVNTPARDWRLRSLQDEALYSWAMKKNEKGESKYILLAGHTHRPVFRSDRLKSMEKRLTEASEKAQSNPADEELRKEVAHKAAQLEWQKVLETSGIGVYLQKPCYFNTGCCCFSDGDVTGLEIADGVIRLIRWPDDHAEPHPKTLAQEPLAEIFAKL